MSLQEPPISPAREAGAQPPPPTRPGRAARRSPAQPRRRTWRILTVVVMLVGLGASVIARLWAMSAQDVMVASGPWSAAQASRKASARSETFGAMDSFALALLLGGLRGPLVEVLWMQIESQKNEHELEDVDTMIEWVRLLQPEFERVQIFQIWNKAYNISVQMASLPDRYSAILDAVDYAQSWNRSHPDDINVMLALEQLYNAKLGTTTNDSVYYRMMVRKQTEYRPRLRDRSRAGGPRRSLDPMLGPEGNVLPELLAAVPAGNERMPYFPARIVVPARRQDDFQAALHRAGVTLDPRQTKVIGLRAPVLDAGDRIIAISEGDARKIEAAAPLPGILFIYADHNDGSELQYLRQYEPYPYGLSPMALGYNYAKRGQVLMTAEKQAPEQIAKSVVDSKPGQDLRQWSHEEWERATRLELNAFGTDAPLGVDMSSLERPTAGARFEQFKDRSRFASILYGYDLAARLARDSRAEYVRHLSNPSFYINGIVDYGSTIDVLKGEEWMVRGDYDFLKAATLAPGGDRDALLRSALGWYRQAEQAYRLIVLRYYVPIEILGPMVPPQYSRETLYRFMQEDPDGFDRFFKQVNAALGQRGIIDDNADARSEDVLYIGRAVTRQQYIRSLLAPAATQPTTAPATHLSTAPAAESSSAEGHLSRARQ